MKVSFKLFKHMHSPYFLFFTVLLFPAFFNFFFNTSVLSAACILDFNFILHVFTVFI